MDIHREATDLIRKYRIELSVEHRDFLVSACLNAFKEVNQGKQLKKNLGVSFTVKFSIIERH